MSWRGPRIVVALVALLVLWGLGNMVYQAGVSQGYMMGLSTGVLQAPPVPGQDAPAPYYRPGFGPGYGFQHDYSPFGFSGRGFFLFFPLLFCGGILLTLVVLGGFLRGRFGRHGHRHGWNWGNAPWQQPNPQPGSPPDPDQPAQNGPRADEMNL